MVKKSAYVRTALVGLAAYMSVKQVEKVCGWLDEDKPMTTPTVVAASPGTPKETSRRSEGGARSVREVSTLCTTTVQEHVAVPKPIGEPVEEATVSPCSAVRAENSVMVKSTPENLKQGTVQGNHHDHDCQTQLTLWGMPLYNRPLKSTAFLPRMF